jgi:hypothetical protein
VHDRSPSVPCKHFHSKQTYYPPKERPSIDTKKIQYRHKLALVPTVPCTTRHMYSLMRKALRHSSQMRANLSHDFLLHTPSLTSYYTHLSGTPTLVALRHSSHHKCVRSLWLSLVTFALSHLLSRFDTRSTQRLFHPLSPTQFHSYTSCHAMRQFYSLQEAHLSGFQ